MAVVQKDKKEISVGFLQSLLHLIIWHFFQVSYSIYFYSIEYLNILNRTIKQNAVLYLASNNSIEEKYRKIGHELAGFKKTISSLAKVPKHIAFSVMPEKYMDVSVNDGTAAPAKNSSVKINPIAIKSLAREISWAYAAQINVVSLYDHGGILGHICTKLQEQVREAIQLNINGILKIATKEEKEMLELPNIKVMNVDDNLKNLSEFKEYEINPTAYNTLYIFIFSLDAGKDGVVATIKEIMRDKQLALKIVEEANKNEKTKHDFVKDVQCSVKGTSILSLVARDNNTKKNVNRNVNVNLEEVINTKNESSIDTMLNDHLYKIWQSNKIPTEPEVLITHSDINSTLGYLPWQIRLTEFSWLPMLKEVELQDFTDVLVRYGKCHQKLGK